MSLDVYAQARTIMAYVDFRGEVATCFLLHQVLREGRRLVLPRVQWGRRLWPLQVRDLHRDLAPGAYGIHEPILRRCRVLSPRDVDLIVAPGVGFTRHGARLGYGGGYYDRFIRHEVQQAVVVGLAYEAQLVCALPLESHDRPMDLVVTEAGVYP